MAARRDRGRLAAAALAAAVVLAGCAGPARKPAAGKDPAAQAAAKARLAESLVRAGRLPEAIAAAVEAISLDPQNAALRHYHGKLLFLAGRYEQAEQVLRRAIELDPYLTDAHNDLGAVYDRLGRKSEAEAEFQKTLADPAYPFPEKVHLNLGLLYLSVGREEEALRSLRKSVELNPKFYKAHFELAQLLERLGKLEEAAREYEVAAPDYSGRGDYHYRLGLTYFRLGNAGKAREHLSRVIDVSPGSESAAQADALLKLIR